MTIEDNTETKSEMMIGPAGQVADLDALFDRSVNIFPVSVDDNREILYSFPEKLTMLEFFKFIVHAAPLTADFDITNANHQQVFALFKAERDRSHVQEG